ncbi:hypothetical protein FD725_30420 (plasmid) [Nostoc sp. TCL26-01]|nr:hypothetical protein FD725_30420 [Nostoc sp. TCL26-01]
MRERRLRQQKSNRSSINWFALRFTQATSNASSRSDLVQDVSKKSPVKNHNWRFSTFR